LLNLSGWEELLIVPTATCSRSCPDCAWQAETAPRSPDFFRSLLEAARSIPRWSFAFGSLPPAQEPEWLSLLDYAWFMQGGYALHTVADNLNRLPLTVWRRSRRIVFGLDEYKVPESDWEGLIRLLGKARREHLPVEVEINLTDQMLDRLLNGLLFERLLSYVHKIHFCVPKHPRLPLLHRDAYAELLEYLIRRMRTELTSSKVEFDPCLFNILSLKPDAPNPPRAWQRRLILLPDGSLKQCPHRPSLIHIQDPRTFSVLLGSGLPGELFPSDTPCAWRDAWKAQETPALYSS
jgi:hypothetical protein